MKTIDRWLAFDVGELTDLWYMVIIHGLSDNSMRLVHPPDAAVVTTDYHAALRYAWHITAKIKPDSAVALWIRSTDYHLQLVGAYMKLDEDRPHAEGFIPADEISDGTIDILNDQIKGRFKDGDGNDVPPESLL